MNYSNELQVGYCNVIYNAEAFFFISDTTYNSRGKMLV